LPEGLDDGSMLKPAVPLPVPKMDIPVEEAGGGAVIVSETARCPGGDACGVTPLLPLLLSAAECGE